MYGMLFALARVASAAWIGAATLFVIVAMQQAAYLEQKPRGISNHLKALLMDDLALLRFPAYYVVGGALIGAAILSLLLIGRRGYLKLSRWLIALGCLTAAAGLMAYDYRMVYRPLVTTILSDQKSSGLEPFVPSSGFNKSGAVGPAPPATSPEEYTRSPQFAMWHEHSKLVNEIEILLVLAATLTLSWPGTRPTQHTVMMRKSAH